MMARQCSRNSVAIKLPTPFVTHIILILIDDNDDGGTRICIRCTIPLIIVLLANFQIANAKFLSFDDSS